MLICINYVNIASSRTQGVYTDLRTRSAVFPLQSSAGTLELDSEKEVEQEGSESNEGTGSRRRRVLWLADLSAPLGRRSRGRHRGQLRAADHRPRARGDEPHA